LIKTSIEELLKTKASNVYLEITANKKFGDRLKNEIPLGRDIIFDFLKQAAPDITGFIKDKYSSDFIVVEFKKEKIKLDDIYQTRKYRDLFNAKFAFLISLESIPEELRRLDKSVYLLRSGLSYFQAFVLARFDLKQSGFSEWYPENPFEKETYWK
jgi:hypothetical protein